MSLLNQMLRDLEQKKSTDNLLFARENSLYVSPNASKKKVNKVQIIGVSISSIIIFFAYLALSKAKQPTMISQPLAIPVLKTPLQQISKESLVSIKAAHIKVKPELPSAIVATSVKSKPTIMTKLLKSSPKKTSSMIAPVIIPPKQAKNSIKSAPLNTRQQAESLYQQALESNNSEQAMHLLKQSIELAPKHISSRLLLIRLLINSGEKQNAINLLDKGLVISPQNTTFIMARAQLYLQEKNSESALQLLNQVTMPAKNEAYLALLAAAYQQHKSYIHSRTHYQTLVQLNANKAEYWLGLALAQDALKQKEAAYNAYQQALNLHSLNSAVTNYIQHRLQQLP
ncbi:tetratricopeptide repeat protein [methanotrophic endosymbiont of Bathymodiolus puteoserpentis (Logatchev)]|jgi:tetratricopeptide (TPR) repeat protein|uniref:tetratricopeptide repeat protein n=1 Tax=methanotrophic endosymbiont of Bathymodiolus puteoserpentis (Logatchev) TaxID=343235 RepID=UPI0013C7E4A6|nr:tetratricopeptide repeat protein [methanotrophic endosymbiont of Bathymodiolus puteoserpentis (Logatchev)]SHE22582.1 MSHA biogenesis protein MshN [methanotrophic endosymbiont of Bathymodiolus puteoserpentis (Logatchev)]